MEQRRSVSEELYTDRNLPNIFRVVQWKVATQAQWKQAFDNLWPPKNHTLTAWAQNYKQCSYYLEWKTLVSSLEVHEVDTIRTALRERFNMFYWAPAAHGERIWNSRSQAKECKRWPDMSTGPAPVIYIHPSKGLPSWDLEEGFDTI
jgi:hypothetical protein